LEVRSRRGEFPVRAIRAISWIANILVYAFTIDPRAATAQALLERGCIIGV
jgi:hypothetical protein